MRGAPRRLCAAILFDLVSAERKVGPGHWICGGTPCGRPRSSSMQMVMSRWGSGVVEGHRLPIRTGLAVGTLLTLGFVPALYSLMFKGRSPACGIAS